MTMPGDITFDSGNSWFGGNLTAFVDNGTIAEARLNDMATRILACKHQLSHMTSFNNIGLNSMVFLAPG